MTALKKMLAFFFALTLLNTGYTQTLNKAKLDQLFDRIAEKNKGMGSITIAKGGKVIYTRSFGFSQITETVKTPLM